MWPLSSPLYTRGIRKDTVVRTGCRRVEISVLNVKNTYIHTHRRNSICPSLQYLTCKLPLRDVVGFKSGGVSQSRTGGLPPIENPTKNNSCPPRSPASSTDQPRRVYFAWSVSRPRGCSLQVPEEDALPQEDSAHGRNCKQGEPKPSGCTAR